MEFQSWKVNFKTEVWANAVLFQITMQRIKEVEIAESIDDLLTSHSITGPRDFSHLEMLGVKNASVSRVCISEGESVSKRNVLKNTTDSYKGGSLLT